jgi:hypothetical protein
LEAASANPVKAAEVSPPPAVVRHETVKRGNHQQELNASEYVIVGSFKSADNAGKFSEGLLNLNFQAQYGYLTEKDLWYVYILQTPDPEKATSELNRVTKLFLLRDAWLLTVQP